MTAAAASFYPPSLRGVPAGGTLRQAGAGGAGGALWGPGPGPSYVERQADKELYEGVLRGEFCYVLASRQTGQSSPRSGVRSRHPRRRPPQRGTKRTCPSHSPSRLQSTRRRRSSLARPRGTERGNAHTPGIGRPARTRSYAYRGIVFRSCVRTIRPACAAHSRMGGSCAPDSPTSCTRKRSTCGRRRRSPVRCRR